MRVLVTGGCGYIGSHTAVQMLAAGMQPVLLVRSGHAGKVRHPAECVTIEGDIADMGAVNSLLSQADAAIRLIGDELGLSGIAAKNGTQNVDPGWDPAGLISR